MTFDAPIRWVGGEAAEAASRLKSQFGCMGSQNERAQADTSRFCENKVEKNYENDVRRFSQKPSDIFMGR